MRNSQIKITNRKSKIKNRLSLVELMIAITITAILVATIFVAIDPIRRLHESRNARRAVDIATILDAIKQSQFDPSDIFNSQIASFPIGSFYQIGTASAGCAIPCGHQTTHDQCLNLGEIASRHLSFVPKDPKTGSTETTGYAFSKNSPDSFTIEACDAEGEGSGGGGAPPNIRVSR